MIRILIVVLLLLCNTAVAEQRRVGNLVIDDSIFKMDSLPPEVATMTAAQFQVWAENFNARQYADAEDRHKAALDRGEFKGVDGYRTSSASKSSTAYSQGPGGFIPRYNQQGSWGSGINNAFSYGATRDFGNGISISAYPNSFGGGGGSSGSSGGYSTPLNSSTTDTFESTAYPMHWKDLNDNGGGPVCIINPYCYDYWIKHTEAPTPGPKNQ